MEGEEEKSLPVGREVLDVETSALYATDIEL
jgi:hypothetical protein